MFTVHVEGPSFELNTDEIWPDGDAPENPTAEDVAKAMRDYCKGDMFLLISDWNLNQDIEVYIDGYVKV